MGTGTFIGEMVGGAATGGIPTAITAVSNLAESIVSRIWPDKTEAEKAALQLELQQAIIDGQQMMGQIEVNKVEASSTRLFVAGWRPFIGWVCGSGLAWEYGLRGILDWIATVAGYSGGFPPTRGEELIPLLTALLGLGLMRSAEKIKGVA